MKKILVPTDFSEEANTAIEFASFLAQNFKCQLILIHVADAPETQPGTLMANFEHLINHAKTKALKMLKNIRQTLEKEGISQVQCVVKEGDLYIELTEFIKKEKIDLLVMGTKAYHSLVEVIAGSNTFEIVDERVCPVLVVPNNGVDPAITDILLATDYEPVVNTDSFRTLIQLAAQFRAKVDIVHVDTGKVVDRKRELKLVSDLRKQLSPLTRPTFHVVQGDDIADALYGYMVESNANLLVLVSRKRGFFKTLLHHSIVREMVHRPKMPLLILPDMPVKITTRKSKSNKAMDLH
jgi:nucleotide-binding universal stress UspA family protein